jgi:hypothetical protein
MAFAISISGFQSGCEHIAKEVDIALVPPITGDSYWFRTLSKRILQQNILVANPTLCEKCN